nr:hypothetical protein CPAG_05029 [Coccidioides posadasii RMSCC 3488]
MMWSSGQRIPGHIFHTKCHYFEDSLRQGLGSNVFHTKATTFQAPQGKPPISHISHDFLGFSRQSFEAMYFQAKLIIIRLPWGNHLFTPKATAFLAPQGKIFQAMHFKPKVIISNSPGANHLFHIQNPQLSQPPRAKIQKNKLHSKTSDSMGQRILLGQTAYFQLKPMPCLIP